MPGMNASSVGSGGSGGSSSRFAKRPFNTGFNNSISTQTAKASTSNGWQSRIKDNKDGSSTIVGSSRSRFESGTNRNRTDSKSQSQFQDSSRSNPNGKSKATNGKSYGLGLTISPPIAGLESESDMSDPDMSRDGKDAGEEEEGPPPSVPVKPYPPRLTLTSSSFKSNSKFNLLDSAGSSKISSTSLLSPLRTGFELQDEDEEHNTKSESTSTISKSFVNGNDSKKLATSSNIPFEDSSNSNAHQPDDSLSNSPESSFTKRRAAYRSGYTDGGTTDGEGYADEVEIATASVNTVRRIGVGSGGAPSSSSTSSATPNKTKKAPSAQLPKILASSPSGSSRPLEPITSSTSLNNLADESYSLSSKRVNSRDTSLSAQDSEEDEVGNQSRSIFRYSSSKSRSKSNSRKVSSASSPKGSRSTGQIGESNSANQSPNPNQSGTYDTSTDGSTTTTTVLASIFDESDHHNDEDSSPRETLIPTSRDSLLRQLAAEQARVDVNTHNYSILSSNELEEYQNELKVLERRSKDVRHKLAVKTRIRDAAIKLRRAHRRTPSQSASSSANVEREPPFSTSSSRVRRNPSVSSNGGKSSFDDSQSTIPSPGYSLQNLPSPGLPPLPSPSLGRNRSATFTNVGQAEVEAEASASAASANVDAVAEELLSISERSSELRTKIVQHQAAVLAFRLDSLENQSLLEARLKSNKVGGVNELKSKFKEREKNLIDQINESANSLIQMRELERKGREEIQELTSRLDESRKEKIRDQSIIRKLKEELKESQQNQSGKVDDQELKKAMKALDHSRLELESSREQEGIVLKQKADLERKISELENSLQEERRLNKDSQSQTSRSLSQTQEELKVNRREKESIREKLQESEERFKELELNHSKEKKLFEERAQLFSAFERNLNETEERLKTEEKNLAGMLGKVDGREEMDDLLSMIKSGGDANIKKDRLAGAGIQDLLKNVSEHISDLGEELSRLGSLNEKRRTRPSYDDDSDDEVGTGERSMRKQFKEYQDRDQVDARVLSNLEASKKEIERLASEREEQLRSEIEDLKKESERKESETARALEESRSQVESWKSQAEELKKKESEEKSKSALKAASPSRSGRDFKDITKIAQLEKEIEKLKITAKLSSSSSVTAANSPSTPTKKSLDHSLVDPKGNPSEELIEARKILKELSLMLPPSETLSKIRQDSDPTTQPSVLDSKLSALALVLQPGGSKALPSLPSSNSDLDYNSSSNTTTNTTAAISASSSTSFSITSTPASEFESLPERLRITLQTARSAALLARDIDANNLKMGKDTAEVVMERETLRAQQEEAHQKLIERTQTRVKGLESAVKELRQALESAHSDLRSLESISGVSTSRPPTLRSSSVGTNGFGRGPSPTRYNHRAHVAPQPIAVPSSSNSLLPGKAHLGWRSPSPGLNPTSNPTPLLTPSPRKNSFNLPMFPSSSPTPSVASNSSSSHQPRTITLGMDTNQLLARVRELEKELEGNKVWKRKGERVDHLETILDETQHQLDESKKELIDLKENQERQKAQFLSEINSLNDELHSAREMLRQL